MSLKTTVGLGGGVVVGPGVLPFPLCFSVLVSLTPSFLKKKLKKMHLHKRTSSHQSTDTLPSICVFLPRNSCPHLRWHHTCPTGATQCRCRHRGCCGGCCPLGSGGHTALHIPAPPPAHLQGRLQHQETCVRKWVQQGWWAAYPPPHP